MLQPKALALPRALPTVAVAGSTLQCGLLVGKSIAQVRLSPSRPIFEKNGRSWSVDVPGRQKPRQ